MIRITRKHRTLVAPACARLILITMVAGTQLVAVSAMGADLTLNKFQSYVEKKLAPPFGTIGSGKWKALCVCNTNEQVGAIESFNGIPNLQVTCTIPSFDAQGEYVSGFACYDWSPLTK